MATLHLSSGNSLKASMIPSWLSTSLKPTPLTWYNC